MHLAAKATTPAAPTVLAGLDDSVWTALMLALLLATTGTLGWLLGMLLTVAATDARRRCSQCGQGWMATIWECPRPRGRRRQAAKPMDTS